MCNICNGCNDSKTKTVVWYHEVKMNSFDFSWGKLNNLSSSMNNNNFSTEWRRSKVLELASQGYNQSDIS
jgi:hypothetical protein